MRIYDEKWLEATLELLEDSVSDLSEWSARSDDFASDEIGILTKALEIVQAKLEDRIIASEIGYPGEEEEPEE